MKKRRRVSRERLVQALYSLVSQKHPREVSLAAVRDLYPMEGEEDQTFTQAILDHVLAHGEEIDTLIQSASKNWRIERMDYVDLAILRMGVAELVWHNSPVPVVINEAVELAKLYGSEKSKRFINGVLHRISTDVGRHPRK